MKTLYELLGKPTTLFDSHCHLNSSDYDSDREEVIKRSVENRIEKIFDISIDRKSSENSLLITQNSKLVTSFVGIDSEIFVPGSGLFVGFNVDESWFAEQKSSLGKLIADNRELIAGIGETGMDYYWLKRLKVEDLPQELAHLSIEEISKISIDLQEKLFRMHLELAKEFELPLSIHSRNAERECLALVEEYKVLGIFHSYTGGFKTARKILEAGCGLGVCGIITYPNASDLRKIYKKLINETLGNIPSFEVSLENIYNAGFYFETDGPFLSPEGKRGQRNEPANIKMIYEEFRKLLEVE